MTKREAILQALKSKLTGLTSLPSANVFRSRTIPFNRSQLPAVVIEPIQDVADNTFVPYSTWSLTARASIMVLGSGPDEIADPIIEEIHEKIMSDQSLGGLSMDIQPVSAIFEIVDGDQSVAIISLDFRITYRTAVTDLSV